MSKTSSGGGSLSWKQDDFEKADECNWCKRH